MKHSQCFLLTTHICFSPQNICLGPTYLDSCTCQLSPLHWAALKHDHLIATALIFSGTRLRNYQMTKDYSTPFLWVSGYDTLGEPWNTFWVYLTKFKKLFLEIGIEAGPIWSKSPNICHFLWLKPLIGISISCWKVNREHQCMSHVPQLSHRENQLSIIFIITPGTSCSVNSKLDFVSIRSVEKSTETAGAWVIWVIWSTLAKFN